MTPRKKFYRLKKILAKMPSALIAFSGGVDSTFLLAAAAEVLPKNQLLAVTAVSLTYPAEELSGAKKIARQLKVRHKLISTAELNDLDFITNPRNRCYFCKKELFKKLKALAREYRLKYVLDASNISDKADFRPGRMAIKELGVCSPLEEAGLNKAEIRILSRGLGLATWNKPALACLASRLAYGTRITPALLKRVERAEIFLRKMGFSQVRLRDHGQVARIEVLSKDIPRLAAKRGSIIDKLKVLGYNYITLDLEGYRTGSMNEDKTHLS